MIDNFEKIISKLHDARVFGFLFDCNPNTMDLNFILYVQIFSDFNFELYSLEKAFVLFEKAEINQLIINKDLFGGQFFITDILVKQLDDERFKFEFSFNDTSIALILISNSINLISSGIVKENAIQFLPTNWRRILD